MAYAVLLLETNQTHKLKTDTTDRSTHTTTLATGVVNKKYTYSYDNKCRDDSAQ